MKNIQLYFILVILAIANLSCEASFELDETIHIDDPMNVGLPIYSEWGYNTFGAYFDRETFVSNQYSIPLKIITTDSTTTFQFKGQSSYSELSGLKIKFNDLNIESYTQLKALQGDTLHISSKTCLVKLVYGKTDEAVEIIRGGLYLKSVKDMVVDKEFQQIAMSGYFFLQVMYNDEPISISNGRFDIGVSEDNFFVFE